MKNIGIIGGIGPEATMEYYSYMFEKVRERISVDNDFSWVPHIIIYSMGRENYSGSNFGTPDKPEKVRAVIEQLHAAGADFVIGACNALHIVFDELSGTLPIPWISIMDATAEAIKKANLDTVGLLGTYMTMTEGFYHRALASHGIKTITPDEDDMCKVEEIILSELIWNKTLDVSRNCLLGIMEKLVQKGAQGIVLGCTELPLLVKQKDTPILIFPTTTILAQKALDLAWEE